MRKLVNIEILKNPNFWAFYLISSFGQIGEGFDSDTVENLFKVEKKSFNIWWNSFTGFYEGIFDETDGDVENPSSFSVEFKNKVSLVIEFHAGDTYYFLENNSSKESALLGNIGPHWNLPMLRWNELISLMKVVKTQFFSEEIESFVILLLLPCIWITKDDDIEGIIKFVSNVWRKTNLADAENCNYFAKHWCEAVDARKNDFYWFFNDDEVWVTNAEWSSRYHKQPVEQINKITKLLSLACDK